MFSIFDFINGTTRAVTATTRLRIETIGFKRGESKISFITINHTSFISPIHVNIITRIYEKVNRKECIMSKIPNLFRAMEIKGITAKELSEQTNISTGNISDWKSGRCQPSIDSLKIISEYLNLPVDYLIGNDDYFLTENEWLLIKEFRNMNQEQQEKLLKDINVL